MNSSISRLFGVVLLLFALLIVWTSRWTVIDAAGLQNDKLNKLSLYASWQVKEGRILADNGDVLARSVPAGGGTWSRTYPMGSLFGDAVGYEDIEEGQNAGIEKFRLPALTATQQTTLGAVFGPISSSSVGDDVYTTLDPTAQELARTLLAGRVGNVVAIVPQTGAIPVMYSNPNYNSNDPFGCHGAGCEVNNAVGGAYPPGSTFKVVTTTAALNSGMYNPQSVIVGNSPLLVSGIPLHNDGNQSWGPVSLTTGLVNSINTVYAQVGQNLGRATMARYMQRFGFYSDPPLDYPGGPDGEMIASGERNPNTGNLQPVSSDQVDLGRMSIGQGNLLVTPLQMAMVVSAVADDGTLMRPHLTSKIVNPDGQVVEAITPSVYSQVMSPAVAAELQSMMTKVVEEGTGEAANLDGLDAAGKTGTASTSNVAPIDDAWFIGFAPASAPKIAVAVELTHIVNGYGGVYAAPIAAQLMKLLLSQGL
jgi:peptidoglycan glycosyltransferase